MDVTTHCVPRSRAANNKPHRGVASISMLQTVATQTVLVLNNYDNCKWHSQARVRQATHDMNHYSRDSGCTCHWCGHCTAAHQCARAAVMTTVVRTVGRSSAMQLLLPGMSWRLHCMLVMSSLDGKLPNTLACGIVVGGRGADVASVNALSATFACTVAACEARQFLDARV